MATKLSDISSEEENLKDGNEEKNVQTSDISSEEENLKDGNEEKSIQTPPETLTVINDTTNILSFFFL